MNSLLSYGSHAFGAGRMTLHSPFLPSMLCVTSKVTRGRFKSTHVDLAQKVEGIRHSMRKEADYESQMRVSIPETIRELRNSIGILGDKLEITRREFSEGIQKLGTELREENKKLGAELREDIKKLGTELREDIKKLGTELREEDKKLGTELREDIKKLGTELREENKKLGTELREDIKKLGERTIQLETSIVYFEKIRNEREKRNDRIAVLVGLLISIMGLWQAYRKSQDERRE